MSLKFKNGYMLDMCIAQKYARRGTYMYDIYIYIVK